MGLFGSNEKKTLELIENITKTVERQDKLIQALMYAQKSQAEQLTSLYSLMIEHAKSNAGHKIVIMNLAKRVGLDEDVLEEFKRLEQIKG
jgi:uncharacterized protein (UPF0264 family)